MTNEAELELIWAPLMRSVSLSPWLSGGLKVSNFSSTWAAWLRKGGKCPAQLSEVDATLEDFAAGRGWGADKVDGARVFIMREAWRVKWEQESILTPALMADYQRMIYEKERREQNVALLIKLSRAGGEESPAAYVYLGYQMGLSSSDTQNVTDDVQKMLGDQSA